jgi:SAM domain (Sterile alpha motif)
MDTKGYSKDFSKINLPKKSSSFKDPNQNKYNKRKSSLLNIDSVSSHSRKPSLTESTLQYTNSTFNENKLSLSETSLEDLFISNGLEKYINIFKANDVRFQDLPNITIENLIEFKIPIGPRNRILKLIVEINKENGFMLSQPSPRPHFHTQDLKNFDRHVFSNSSSCPKSSSRSKSNLGYENNRKNNYNELVFMLKSIESTQSKMMKAILDNQKAILELQQSIFMKIRCNTEHYDY